MKENRLSGLYPSHLGIEGGGKTDWNHSSDLSGFGRNYANYPPNTPDSFLSLPSATLPIPSIVPNLHASHKYCHAKVPLGTQPHFDPSIASEYNELPPSRSIPPFEPFSHCNTQRHSTSHGPVYGTSSCGNHSGRPRAAAPRAADCSSSRGRWDCSPIGSILVLWALTGVERMIFWSWLWAGRFDPRRCLALCRLGHQRGASGVASVLGCRGVDL